MRLRHAVISSTGLAALFITSNGSVYSATSSIPSYYEDVIYLNCPNTYACSGTLKPIPAGFFVTFTNIACYLTTSTSSIAYTRAFLESYGQSRIVDLPTDYHAAGSLNVTTFNIPIRFKMGSGKVPAIAAFTSGSTNMNVQCTITGTPSTD